MFRLLLLVHRYLGIAIGVIVALWCLSGFVMMYEGGDLKRPAILGDEVRFDPQAELKVELPREASIRVLRDGADIFERQGTRIQEKLPGPGVYRAEAYLEDRLWIVSSPIYIEADA